jgi:hypothetical protein
MEQRFDVYYNNDLCRVVMADQTPEYIKKTWKHSFTFYAFPFDFLPLPKKTTKYITYNRSRYPYNTYGVYADFNPITDFLEHDAEAMNLTFSFIAYSSRVPNTIPIFVFERSFGEDRNIFISCVTKVPRGYTEMYISPIYISTRPIAEFKCINTICVPAYPSYNQMSMYYDWDKAASNESVKNILVKKYTTKYLDRVDLKDRTPRIIYNTIFDCMAKCKFANEKAYVFEMPQTDPIIL